jgi:hypothetical protein
MKKYFPLFLIILLLIPLGFFKGTVHAAASTLEFKTSSVEEDSFTIQVYINLYEDEANAVTANFTYPKDLIKATNIKTTEMFSNVIDADISTEGYVYLSATSDSSVTGEGALALVTFSILNAGTAEFAYTDDSAILDSSTSENILVSARNASYQINALTSLPETGVEESVDPFFGLVLLILLVMIIIFTIMGFSMWGGIYFSLGKWEVGGKYEFGLKKKEKDKKKDKKK